MALKVGDKVRTDTGKEGQVVQVYSDKPAALVKLRGTDPNATLLSLPLASLKRIESYTTPPAD